MKLFLIIFFGIIFGIIGFLFLLTMILWFKFKKAARRHGYDDWKLSNFIDKIQAIREEGKSKPKSLPGMSNYYVPKIIDDFSDFNQNLIYNETEKGLRAIFDSFSNNNIELLNNYPLIKDSVSPIILDNIKNEINEVYDSVKFHGFAIEKYEKYKGVATVTVCTSLEYYYKKIIKNKVKKKSSYKEQKKYSCKFIYVYDDSCLDDSILKKVIGLNCPNCGAPVRSFSQKECPYCRTGLKTFKDINVKAWAFSSYKEQ